MDYYKIQDIRDTFARYFVIAIHNKMHPAAFTDYLIDSKYVMEIEKGNLFEISDISVEEGYHSIVGNNIAKDDSFGIYNDAYWCGHCYFELFLTLHKPFSYLFLKLPLAEMLDLYKVYHEMDISQLEEYFHDREKEETILRLLCKRHRCSINKLSKATGISVNTLNKYRSSDKSLYSASFQNIYRISKYLDTPISLFVEELQL
jgi:hypothetical protein